MVHPAHTFMKEVSSGREVRGQSTVLANSGSEIHVLHSTCAVPYFYTVCGGGKYGSIHLQNCASYWTIPYHTTEQLFTRGLIDPQHERVTMQQETPLSSQKDSIDSDVSGNGVGVDGKDVQDLLRQMDDGRFTVRRVTSMVP